MCDSFFKISIFKMNKWAWGLSASKPMVVRNQLMLTFYGIGCKIVSSFLSKIIHANDFIWTSPEVVKSRMRKGAVLMVSL